MLKRLIPEWHVPKPSVRGFATLAGFEAVTRGVLISVFPVAMYDALQDAALVSSYYFGIGIVSLLVGLLVPFLNRFVPRHFIYSAAVLSYVVGSGFAVFGTPGLLVLALVLNSIATVVAFVCCNAYVLDYIARIELGKCETLRMFYSALGWTVGPVLGVVLWTWWKPAPFLVSAAVALLLLLTFLCMSLGNGKLITRAHRPALNPLAYLGRFIAQPRLVAGWLFAVIRSCGWWAFVVYLPIFALQSGLGEKVGGILLSLTNASLFLSPFVLRWMQASSVRTSVRTGFCAAAVLFMAAGALGAIPWLTVACLFAGSFFLILLDICGGLPFLMAVKPSERNEMSAIYSSFRDVSGILTPGAAWIVLLVFPISGIFAAAGGVCLLAWHISGKLHPRLGQHRMHKV
ncbi:MAG: MFS transporter [Proteobacteria bacterium]|nr:MFS transporter [Pseudomonadota bacterium]MDA1332352.1 MFS transporter [Pseudomonadota bacterium]